MSVLQRKEISALLDHVEEQGVRTKRTKNGVMLYLPDGTSTSLHFTNSDWRGTLNLRARLKRAGVTWPNETRPNQREDQTVPKGYFAGKPTEKTVKSIQQGIAELPDPYEFTTRQLIDIMGGSTSNVTTYYRALDYLGYEREVFPSGRSSQTWKKVLTSEDKSKIKGGKKTHLTAVEKPAETDAETPAVEPDEAAPAAEYVEAAKAEETAAQPAEATVQQDGSREFIDSHDSWSINMDELPGSDGMNALTLDQLRTVFAASGLHMEIRVWRKDKTNA